jgi:solute carrier family 25 phosphate transporter 3
MKDMGLIKSGLKIIKDDKEGGGINALLAGLGPTTIGYLLEGSVKFGVYEVLKPLVRNLLVWSATITRIPFFDSRLLGFMISGTLAGTAASAMLCPMEAIRIRLVAEPECSQNGNWVDCGIKMIGNEGVKGLWKSLPSMLYKQVPYTVTKNVSFDLITTAAYLSVAGCGRVICGRTKVVIPLLSAMIASVLSTISSQPGDMLLSVMNAHEGKLTTRDHIKSIMKEDGIRGFFVGIRERFVHVGMIVTVQLLLYDFVKRLVGINATGL